MAEGTFELDIDRERIRLDDEWLSVADLMSRIKDKIEAGDYKVARLSMALEQLESTLAVIRTVTLKVTPELVDTFEKVAQHEGVPLTWVLRRALVHYLASDEGSAKLFRARRESQPEPSEAPRKAEPPPIPADLAADGG
jgi:hypothetical protein